MASLDREIFHPHFQVSLMAFIVVIVDMKGNISLFFPVAPCAWGQP